MLPVAPVVTIPINLPNVPFYSQFQDISSPKWQKVGCGIASLAMVIDYYDSDAISVDTLLEQAIASGAYQYDAGWKHKDMVLLSQRYGLDGDNYDLSMLNKAVAFERFKDFLKDGPVIASVHYKFDPQSTIPHLVVIDGFDGDVLYYNDPAANMGKKRISTGDFLKSWKKRFIVIRPVKEGKVVAKVLTPNTAVGKRASVSEVRKDENKSVAVVHPVAENKETASVPVSSVATEKISLIEVLKDLIKRFIVVSSGMESNRVASVVTSNVQERQISITDFFVDWKKRSGDNVG